MFEFKPGRFGFAKGQLAPPWSPAGVHWLEEPVFFILRTVHEGEVSRWCLGARLPKNMLFTHERTFERSVREKTKVLRKVKMNPWPVFCAVDAPWQAWARALEKNVGARAPLVDNNYIALWAVPSLSLPVAAEPRQALVLDGHHSFEAQARAVRSGAVMGWFLPFRHPELSVRAIHRAGWLKAALERAIARGEAREVDDAEAESEKNAGEVIEAIQSQKKFFFKISRAAKTAVDWVSELGGGQERVFTSPNLDELLSRLAQNEVDTVLRLPDLEKETIWDRALERDLLPQKATYFFPKVPFGLMVEDLRGL